MIKVSPSASPLDSIADFLGIKSDEPEATLNIIEFGSFTANFKALPPPISSEYLIPLYGIIITTIVGWSIPSIIGWIRAKADAGRLNNFHKKIKSLYDDGKLDENDIEALDRLRGKILDAYSKGKVNDKHYESLKSEISLLYEKIFRKRIDSLNYASNKEIIEKQLDKIKNNLENAYSEGKISELHYNLLKEKIAKIVIDNNLK